MGRSSEVAGRWRRRGRRQIEVERHPDDLPKRGLFTEPVRVAQLVALEPEWLATDPADPDPADPAPADPDPTGEAAASTGPADPDPAATPAAAPRVRVTFMIEVKDAEDRRCSDLAVDARMDAPDRSGKVQGATDLFGRVKVQMTGPPGHYAIEVLEVAAKALTFDRSAGPTTAHLDVAP